MDGGVRRLAPGSGFIPLPQLRSTSYGIFALMLTCPVRAVAKSAGPPDLGGTSSKRVWDTNEGSLM